MERVDSFLISAVGFLVSVGRTQTTGTKAKNRVVVESHILSKCFFNLRGEFVGESVQALSQFANILEKIVVSDEGGDRREEARCGGDKCFGDAGSNGAEAGGTGSAEAGEGVNDAPNRTKKTDERSDASCGSQPRHALFDTTDLVGGRKLHADGDGLERLESLRSRIARASDLGLQFAVSGGVDIGERGACGDESLGIGNALGGAKDFEELIALAADATEQAEFLEDERPGDQGEEEKNAKDDTRDPASLRKNVKNITDEECG